jgi:N-acetylneuraminic acid mutarotase
VAIKSAVMPSSASGYSCTEDASTHKIYCFGTNNADGGSGGGGTPVNQITEYNPATNTLLTKSTTMPTARGSFSCVYVGSVSKIYCFGGAMSAPPFPSVTNQILEYAPSTNTLAIRSAVLPSARYAHSCSPNSTTGKIYCLGGQTDAMTSISQIIEYQAPVP